MVLDEFLDLLSPEVNAHVNLFLFHGFVRVAVAKQIYAYHPVVLAHLGVNSAPIISVGPESMHQDYRLLWFLSLLVRFNLQVRGGHVVEHKDASFVRDYLVITWWVKVLNCELILGWISFSLCVSFQVSLWLVKGSLGSGKHLGVRLLGIYFDRPLKTFQSGIHESLNRRSSAQESDLFWLV